jgi:hypothetical protein
MFGLLGILKNPLDNIKQIAILVFVVALGTYCVTLWVKNSDLVDKVAKDAGTITAYDVANKAFVVQLAAERAEKQRVDDLLREAQKAALEVKPIYIEIAKNVETYRKDPTIVKFVLPPAWVSIHNKAATNPYTNSTNISAGGSGSSASGSGVHAN